MLKKIHRKLLKEQKERGVIFSSCLSPEKYELEDSKVHEVLKDESGSTCKIARLKCDNFFVGGNFKYNIIRSD